MARPCLLHPGEVAMLKLSNSSSIFAPGGAVILNETNFNLSIFDRALDIRIETIEFAWEG